ncbi:MAG TPA: DPP IV N-terminal domain-containing protein [Puia sp.]|nr:DPP IV N-terminal domain-containing protein [Puia sp.]
MNKSSLVLVALLWACGARAQQGRALTDNDYAHAETLLSYGTEPYVDRGFTRPNWLSGDRFWYRVLTAKGSEFILVNPERGTRTAAFDQARLASGLSAATGQHVDPDRLPFGQFSYSGDGRSIHFRSAGKNWMCDLSRYSVVPDTAKAEGFEDMNGGTRAAEELSPDGKKAAYIKDYNLWVRDLTTGKETQLTTDGVKDFGYATDNAGWRHSDRPVLLWSPDSKKIATFQDDQRNVGEMYLWTTNVGHPVLHQWKYPLPGDPVIPMIQRVVIEVDNPKVIRLQVPPDPHRGTLSDDISSGGSFDDVDWSPDGSQLAFVSTSRDHKDEKFRIADAATGAVREVFEETVPTQFESGRSAIDWRFLPGSNEIIWYSERDNWGHLYLYDATTGKLKNQITKGQWVVSRLYKVDQKKRLLYFTVAGRETENPYFNQLYKVNFDGSHLELLTPEAGNHVITFSPAEDYFVDTYSKPDVPPVSVLRNLQGKIVVPLEKTDISRLEATGWKPPTPFSVKAHDGVTDIYGLLFTPEKLDSGRKYPIIDYIYPGPQGGSVGSWNFLASRGDNQALAELGFVVVEIEGTSNPYRSKSFHDMSYGNMAENTLPDQVTGIRQLAGRYAYIDTGRVGIWGHSGGGFATAGAMFRYPYFFKVGISESGNHDNRNYEDDWGERYDGLVANSDYAAQANEAYAKNLKGKLMLAHGLMDDNVPPSNTFLVIDALEKANKDYDLVVFPNSPHGYGQFSPYMMRRRWDYFVRNLAGMEPPHEYQLKMKTDPRNEGIGGFGGRGRRG